MTTTPRDSSEVPRDSQNRDRFREDGGRVTLRAPFPWFGGKSRAAGLIWDRLGDVANYVEPFFGSGAVLLNRPHAPKVETVNDLDCYLANFWRSVQRSPEAVATEADWPVNEADLHAFHAWLIAQREVLRERMHSDADYYDAKIAGRWVWGICQWVGTGWCEAESRQLWATGGKGAGGPGIHGTPFKEGPTRRLASLGNTDKGVLSRVKPIHEWFDKLSQRLRYVRVACGSWERVLSDSVTWNYGGGRVCGIVLDPPYPEGAVDYAPGDNRDAWFAARDWAVANGDNPALRIALCGYEGQDMPASWEAVAWKANGGYGNRNSENKNSRRERVWFSPHCLRAQQASLFGGAA